MNRRASFPAARRLCVLQLVCWLVFVPAGLLAGWNPSALAATNSAKAWPTLAEVRKKFDGLSIEAVHQAAEKGDLTAQHYLGFCYASGERVGKDAAAALTWYQRAGDAGYLPALNNLGVLYYQGKEVPRDLAKAIGYYRRAAAGSLAQAQANLGFVYRDGEGVAANATEALKWFRLAADQGHTTAMVNVGRAYRFGRGVAEDAQAAIRWFRAADERGDPLGTVNLGWMYGYVDESPRDQAQAAGLFQKAADLGQLDAMYELYLAYKDGRGVARDEHKATVWLTQAAKAGNPMAQHAFGRSFAHPPFDAVQGQREPKNMPEAVHWYQLSAEQGYSRAQYDLGLCYAEGDGVEQDEEKGLELLRAAADQGYNLAKYELAGLYARGIGAPRNQMDQPLELLESVARSSSKSLTGVTKWAYDGILFRYQYGIGTEPDLVMAAEWYCQAAGEGVWEYSLEDKLEPNATPAKIESGGSFVGSAERSYISIRMPDMGGSSDQFRQFLPVYLRASKLSPAALAEIGNRYLTGRGVAKNPMKAWLWLTLAGQHGTAGIRPAITEIEARLTHAELEEARRALPKLVQTLDKVAQILGESSGAPHPGPSRN